MGSKDGYKMSQNEVTEIYGTEGEDGERTGGDGLWRMRFEDLVKE